MLFSSATLVSGILQPRQIYTYQIYTRQIYTYVYISPWLQLPNDILFFLSMELKLECKNLFVIDSHRWFKPLKKYTAPFIRMNKIFDENFIIFTKFFLSFKSFPNSNKLIQCRNFPVYQMYCRDIRIFTYISCGFHLSRSVVIF